MASSQEARRKSVRFQEQDQSQVARISGAGSQVKLGLRTGSRSVTRVRLSIVP